MADINTYLILFKKKDKTLDRTLDIESFSRDGRYIKLKFFGRPTVYTCGPDKAEVFSGPEELPAEEYAFVSKGCRYADLVRVQKFAEHWRIFLQNGKSICLKQSEVEVIHSCLGDTKNKTLFDYLKALAIHDSLKIDGGASFLGKQYAKVDFVSEDTVLSYCLKGAIPAEEPAGSSAIYYPFGFNTSQKKAVRMLLRTR